MGNLSTVVRLTPRGPEYYHIYKTKCDMYNKVFNGEWGRERIKRFPLDAILNMFLEKKDSVYIVLPYNFYNKGIEMDMLDPDHIEYKQLVNCGYFDFSNPLDKYLFYDYCDKQVEINKKNKVWSNEYFTIMFRIDKIEIKPTINMLYNIHKYVRVKKTYEIFSQMWEDYGKTGCFHYDKFFPFITVQDLANAYIESKLAFEITQNPELIDNIKDEEYRNFTLTTSFKLYYEKKAKADKNCKDDDYPEQCRWKEEWESFLKIYNVHFYEKISNYL